MAQIPGPDILLHSHWKGDGKLHRMVNFVSLLVDVPFPFLMRCILFVGRSGSHGTEPETRAITNTLRGEVWGADYPHAPWDDNVALLKQAAVKRLSWTQAWLGFYNWETASAVARIHFWSHFLMCFLYIFQIMHTLVKLGQAKSSAKSSLPIHLRNLSYANLNAQGRPAVVLKWSQHHDFVKWPHAHSFMEKKKSGLGLTPI